MYSKETMALTTLCFDGEEPRSTNAVIGETYEYAGQKLKVTETTYEELLKYQEESERKFKINRSGKIINLLGVR